MTFRLTPPMSAALRTGQYPFAPLVRVHLPDYTLCHLVAVTVGLLLHAWQAEVARADENAALFASERDLRMTAETQLKVERAAAMERAADDRAIDDLSKDMTDAIDKAAAREPGKAPGAATTALGCSRLRAAGATASAEYKRLCR